MPGEDYTHGTRLRCYVVGVTRGMRGPQVTVSRTHPNLVKKLFALEVPEIADGSVEIVDVAREAGHRTKIAVRTTVSGLNAKGACIGPMGQRVRNVVAELHGEKIDIVDWAEDPATYVGNALSPAHALESQVVDPAAQSVRVVVPDFQLSLAIGREGQNARLAARLTGWRIDIHSDAEDERRAAQAAGDRPTRRATRGRLHDGRPHRATASDPARTGAPAPDPDLHRVPAAGGGRRVAPRGRGTETTVRTVRSRSTSSRTRPRRMVAPRPGVRRARRAAPGLRAGPARVRPARHRRRARVRGSNTGTTRETNQRNPAGDDELWALDEAPAMSKSTV